ncbi:LysR family transcriptional regulator [Companilactobacillus paralimentarius]|uniref:LysR family transcriptional regulator n=1 Tax=Companilactobacillus paralimentarius TaxID=83526 RepID=UPI0028534E6F|nr:LysR family transcriptional regulator [Companilactobacillus paralimentarius]MDR4934687.1 LysR family transcriptional regulator [Companilactobacillus paralimentarius]
MELRVLNYFLMIAREENITRAANLLHVSQLTLSRQIAALEEELGTKLFVRQSHKITLTEDGLLLRRRAEEMRQLSDKIKEEMTKDKGEIAGEIAIGGGELQSMNELSQIMAAFRQKYPLVTFKIQSGNSKDTKWGIEQGLLDLGLLIEPVSTEKYDFARMHPTEQWGVMTAVDSPLAQLDYVESKDLRNQTLIMSNSRPMESELNHWFGSDLKQINIAANYNLLYNAVIMARAGLGSVLCLKLEAHYKGMKFVPLKPALTYNSVLAWKADQIAARNVLAFIDFTKKYLEGISDDEK